jgi:hypothetical protein
LVLLGQLLEPMPFHLVAGKLGKGGGGFLRKQLRVTTDGSSCEPCSLRLRHLDQFKPNAMARKNDHFASAQSNVINGFVKCLYDLGRIYNFFERCSYRASYLLARAKRHGRTAGARRLMSKK